jgi:hypothetical protein
LRVVVTSRFEKDIQEALQSRKALDVDYMLMEDIPTDLTARDIALYVHDALGDVQDLEPTDLNRVATAADDSFQWASTARRYICNSDDERGCKAQEPDYHSSAPRVGASMGCIYEYWRNTLGRNLRKRSRCLSSSWT